MGREENQYLQTSSLSGFFLSGLLFHYIRPESWKPAVLTVLLYQTQDISKGLHFIGLQFIHRVPYLCFILLTIKNVCSSLRTKLILSGINIVKHFIMITYSRSNNSKDIIISYRKYIQQQKIRFHEIITYIFGYVKYLKLLDSAQLKF